MLEPWSGEPDVGLGFLVPEIPLLNFYPPHMGMGPTHSESVPFLPSPTTSLDIYGFFNSIVIRLPFKSVS